MAVEDKPSLLVLRSHIGWPAPNKTDTPEAHGNPLGADEVRATKEILGLPPDEQLLGARRGARVLPPVHPARPGGAARRGSSGCHGWTGDSRRVPGLPRGPGTARAGRRSCRRWPTGDELATRAALSEVLGAIVDVVPGLITGGADLTDNTGNYVKGCRSSAPTNPTGRLVHYGVREHGMGG